MILLVEAETVDRPHWGWKNPKAIRVQQWGILVNGLMA